MVKVRQAVVLCGRDGVILAPLQGPACMLPILNRPLLEHLVRFLERQGVEQVFIAMDCEQELPSKKLQKVFPNLRVEFRSSELPLGGGGWLLSLREELGEGPFLVLSCNSLPGNLEVTRMVAEHCQSSATLTLCLEPGPTSSLEGFSLDAQRRVEGFVSLHLSAERRASYQDQGIYLVNRVCFDFINPDGYFDLREQLVAKVTAAGHTVHGHVTPGAARLLRDVDDYFNANLEALQGQDQITVGKDSRISPTAVISGPVLMGDNCLIEDRAVVIGPAVIGDDCVLREGSEIRECVLWTSTEVEADCSARWCVTARPGLKLETRKKYSHQILTADPTSGDLNLTPRRYCLSGLSEVGGQRGMSRHKLFLKSKRAMDLAVSSTLLILLAPLLLFLALAVKLDSPGPAFFRQRRCGLEGREFELIKLRTMVAGAHSMQTSLSDQNEVDGPVFKIAKDPRVTKLGRLLRSTSLDELPQLFNVWKGEMSLVGPRPLVMTEMALCPVWRSTRLKVKPGVTGLWQVNGRSGALFHDWIRFDMAYVMQQSLWLDIKILFATARVVLSKAGAY